MSDGTQVEGITQVAMTVNDVPSSVAFYRDGIGLPQLPIPAGPTMAFFMMGPVRLMISQPEAGFMPGGGTVMYLTVRRIKEAVAAMKSRGVAFIRDEHMIAKLPDREVWLAELKDPSGNTLALMSEVRLEV
jgi:methylmalonyl-CoA/ethylmalonyl-CoA epimerase